MNGKRTLEKNSKRVSVGRLAWLQLVKGIERVRARGAKEQEAYSIYCYMHTHTHLRERKEGTKKKKKKKKKKQIYTMAESICGTDDHGRVAQGKQQHNDYNHFGCIAYTHA